MTMEQVRRAKSRKMQYDDDLVLNPRDVELGNINLSALVRQLEIMIKDMAVHPLKNANGLRVLSSTLWCMQYLAIPTVKHLKSEEGEDGR